MLLSALVFPLLMARAAANASDFVPDGPLPWGVAMLGVGSVRSSLIQ
eukprot:COSAG01_NODE_1496_length_10123_cov_3.358739_12_plen_47_part_00